MQWLMRLFYACINVWSCKKWMSWHCKHCMRSVRETGQKYAILLSIRILFFLLPLSVLLPWLEDIQAEVPFFIYVFKIKNLDKITFFLKTLCEWTRKNNWDFITHFFMSKNKTQALYTNSCFEPRYVSVAMRCFILCGILCNKAYTKCVCKEHRWMKNIVC